MLEFDFDVSSDDYIAYNLFALNQTPAGIRQFRSFRLASAVLVGAASFGVIAFILTDPIGGLVTSVIAAAVTWLTARWSWNRQVRSNVRRMARDNGLGTPGRHRLVVDATGICEQGPSRSTAAAWDMLRRLEVTAEHVFVFTGPIEAFVIPRSAGEYEIGRLLGEIRERRPDLVPVST